MVLQPLNIQILFQKYDPFLIETIRALEFFYRSSSVNDDYHANLKKIFSYSKKIFKAMLLAISTLGFRKVALDLPELINYNSLRISQETV